jgi:hypothetical protein
MAEIVKLKAQRQVTDALRMRNGPDTTAIHDLPVDSQVLVWRKGNAGRSGTWDGPFKLLAIDQETCKVELPHRPTSFRTTVVKPYNKTPEDTQPQDEPEQGDDKDNEEQPRRNPGRNRQLPARYATQNPAQISVFLHNTDDEFITKIELLTC